MNIKREFSPQVPRHGAGSAWPNHEAELTKICEDGFFRVDKTGGL